MHPGPEATTSAPSGTCQTARGLINIAANKDEQWHALAGHLGLDALTKHPEYGTREKRKANRVALRAALEAILMTRPATDWEDELNAIGVPAGAVMTVPDVLAHPQIADRGFLAAYEVPEVGTVRAARTGLKIDGEAPAVSRPPPALDADADRVWSELGLTLDEIKGLREEGVF